MVDCSSRTNDCNNGLGLCVFRKCTGCYCKPKAKAVNYPILKELSFSFREVSISVLFLRVNGFDLPYGDKENKKAIFEILENSMFKFEGDDIYREVEGFLRKRIVKT